MTTMSPADWIAIMLLALSIFAKISVDLAAYLTARKHTALANIVGMAGRQAASAARTLASLPAGVDAKGVEQALVANARDAVVAEMGDLSMPRAKVNVAQVTNLVQGELDKLVVAPVAVLPVPVAGAAVLPAG
jgi:hypothetical protein